MKQVKSTWRNRIVGYSEEVPDQLLANPSNWRIHPAAQQNALSGVLKEVGLVQNVVANRTTGHLVDGHLRVMLAMRENQPVVPVTWVELSEEEEHLILASLDPLAAMATADAGALDALLSSVQSGEAAVTAMLAELAEGAGLYQPQDDPQDAEPQIDRAEELRVKWGVESGQLWRLPSRTLGQEHRLICGDCTDAQVIERLMGNERAALSHHDPPYGADVVKVKGSSNKGSIGGGNWGPVGQYAPVIGDDEPFDPEHLMGSGDVVVLWGANYYADRLPASSGWLVWDKRDGMTSNNFADCELAWISKAMPARLFAHRWMGMVKASEHGQARYHPTQKPVALFAWVLELLTKEGDIVADWYCGAGGQLIAAENLSRQCRAVEIAPDYVAVALERYATAFGIEPELIT